MPPPAVLALAQAALGEGRDLQGEIERARKDVDGMWAEIEAEDEAVRETKKKGESKKPAGAAGESGDLDDDIPF